MRRNPRLCLILINVPVSTVVRSERRPVRATEAGSIPTVCNESVHEPGKSTYLVLPPTIECVLRYVYFWYVPGYLCQMAKMRLLLVKNEISSNKLLCFIAVLWHFVGGNTSCLLYTSDAADE